MGSLMNRVYTETTIPSYLTASPSRDRIRAAHQRITRDCWLRREQYEAYASPLVVREREAGDAEAAMQRREALRGIPLPETTAEAGSLAQALLDDVPMPARAASDALHIAIAAVHGIDFLLPWNCTHLANAVLRNRIEAVCRDAGFKPPPICSRKNGPGKGTAMTEKSVLQQVRAARDEFTRLHDYDPRKILDDLRELDRGGEWKIVRLEPKRPRSPAPAAVESSPALSDAESVS